MVSAILAGANDVPRAVSSPPAGPLPTPDAAAVAVAATNIAPLDETAETVPDYVATMSEALARRAQLLLMRQQSVQNDLQLRLDRMRNDFNAAQEMHSEQLREMNALRDMAVEQGKKDDEILKKYITMI